jgi:hypothetical protein
MKNKLTDLNNHLFAQLERLNDEELAPEEVKTEIERSRAMAGIAREIVSGAQTRLRAAELYANHGVLPADMVQIEDKSGAC